MKVLAIWKVRASSTRIFRTKMCEKGLRMDAPANILNVCYGYNFFYETSESFGDISEDAAKRIAGENLLQIIVF